MIFRNNTANEKTVPIETETDDEQVFQELFEKEELLSKEEKETRAKNLKQKGFQLSDGKATECQSALRKEIENLQNQYTSTISAWNDYCEHYVLDMSKKCDQSEEETKKIREEEQQHHIRIEASQQQKKEAESELHNLRKQAFDIHHGFSSSSKRVGEQIIDNAALELSKVVELQNGIYTKTKAIYDRQFQQAEPAEKVYIKKLETLRQHYEGQLTPLQVRLKHLSEDGINHTTAQRIVALGVTMAGVAGFFFAMFCKSSDYSSDDFLSYLLKNVIGTIVSHENPFYEKFAYLFGTVVVISVISWITNHFIEEKEPYAGKVINENSLYKIDLIIDAKNFKHSFISSEKKWLLLWLKIVPLILIVGTIILLIAGSANAKSDLNKLNSSTEGLLIGTALSLGLSAVLYVYITNVVERRQEENSSKSRMKANRELVFVLLLFMLCLGIFVSYKLIGTVTEIPSNQDRPVTEKVYNLEGAFSIVGFIGSCLIAAIALAYGFRYVGLISSEKELIQVITRIDSLIYQSSFPRQPHVNVNLERYYKRLNAGLIANLDLKNAAAFASYLSSEDAENDKLFGQQKSPPNRTDTYHEKTELGKSDPFELFEWEIWFYPEYARKIQALKSLYHAKQNDLAIIEAELKKLYTEKEEKSRIWNTALQRLEAKKNHARFYIAKAKKKKLQKAERIQAELENALSHLQDGFNLGLWYRKQDGIS